MRHLLLPVAVSDGEEYGRWTVLLPHFLCKSCGHTPVGFPEALEDLEDPSCAGDWRLEAREALHPFFQAPSTSYDWQGWYRGLRKHAARVLLEGKSLMGRPQTPGSLLTEFRTGRGNWLGSLVLRVYISRQESMHILSGDIRVQMARLKAS